ncbi:outer membrane beta-barrel protein [uncultured Porphyromonas sp.]|uniref:outer membrane beta-barrel protein n=1 Tax=uncultured Porphyromonas sp. TaxID=159274 RepID=UPI00261A4FFC|nr:outer membrane beta-barrel protein [uncultured Porphyromonas sp.]
MKYFCILTFLAFLFTVQMSAQEGRYELKGTISTKDQIAVPAATITLRRDTTERAFTGAISQADGSYALEVATPGTYFVEIRCIGYKTLRQSLIIDQPFTQYDFVLSENVEELSEVVVIAKHTRLKPNGTIRVEFKGNPITRGKSMAEALRFVQGVEVNGNNLFINGKEDNQIILNGQTITLQQLNTIPTSMIDHIDVIPNPGVSMGSNIKGGIILVTLRVQEGTLGSISLPLQFDRLGLVDVIPTLFFQHQRGSVTFYNTLRGGAGRYTTKYERQDKYMGSSPHTIQTITETQQKDYAVVDNFGVQYQINAQHRIGLFGGVSYDTPNSTTEDNVVGKDNTLKQRNKYQSLNLNGGLSYNARINIFEGANISSTMSYSRMQNNSENHYILDKEDIALADNNTHYLQINPRVSVQFAGAHSFISGINYAYALDQNRTGGIENEKLKALSKRQFSISGFDFAPFVEYSKMFGERLFLQAGLHYQNTVMQYQDLLLPDRSYRVSNQGFYPNILLQYMISAERSSGIAFAYRRFFSLPNYGYYSPIATYQTENLYSIGNQKLKQETFDEAELTYYINRDWNVTYRMRYGRDIVQIMTHPDESRPNLFYTQPENIGTLLYHYLSFSFNKSLFSFWHTNNVLYLRHNQEEMPERSVRNFLLGGTSTHQFSLSNNWGVTVAFSGQTAQQKLGYHLGATFALDAGCYFSLLTDKLQVSLLASNIVYGKESLTIQHPNAEMVRYNLSPRTRLKLTLSYAFSLGDQIKKARTESAATISLDKPIL